MVSAVRWWCVWCGEMKKAWRRRRSKQGQDGGERGEACGLWVVLVVGSLGEISMS